MNCAVVEVPLLPAHKKRLFKPLTLTNYDEVVYTSTPKIKLYKPRLTRSRSQLLEAVQDVEKVLLKGKGEEEEEEEGEGEKKENCCSSKWTTKVTQTPTRNVSKIIAKPLDPYHQARLSLHPSQDPSLPPTPSASKTRCKMVLAGRVQETETLRKFIYERLLGHLPNSALFISGPPGTGKTALVQHLLLDPRHPTLIRCYINCMSLDSPREIFARIWWELKGRQDPFLTGPTDKEAALERLLGQAKQPYTVLVLDEVDGLSNANLRKIYGWALLPNARVAIIGIANGAGVELAALDQVQRLCFKAYQAEEILTILQALLSDLTFLFNKTALELCARKVTARQGDLRQAFAVCRRAVDEAEKEWRLSGADEVIPIGLKHVLNATKALNPTIAVDAGLGFSQASILAILMISAARRKEVTGGQKWSSIVEVYNMYRRLVERYQLPPSISPDDVVDVVESLEARGLVQVRARRAGGLEVQVLGAKVQGRFEQTVVREMMEKEGCI